MSLCVCFALTVVVVFWIYWATWDQEDKRKLRKFGEKPEWAGQAVCRFSNRNISYSTCYRSTCKCADVNSTATPSLPCDQMLRNGTVGQCGNGPICCGGVCLNNQLCEIENGICSTMTQDLLIPYNNHVYRRPSTHECGFNENCEAGWEATFPLEQGRSCVFNKQNPVATVTWGTRRPAYKGSDTHRVAMIGLWVMVGLFVVVVIVIIVGTVKFSVLMDRCVYWKRVRENERRTQAKEQEAREEALEKKPLPSPIQLPTIPFPAPIPELPSPPQIRPLPTYEDVVKF